jgi:sucrose-6-phosphate hydrolase SacC (GH32 family)
MTLLKCYRRAIVAGCMASVMQISGGVLAQTPPGDELTPEEVASQQHYGQPYRPQFHYTPIQGHMGDATGLIYYRGEYHLFHMFDKWGQARRDRHKCWGHAISRDLIFWEEQLPVLDALVDHKPGSGSGVVDWNDSSGLRTGAHKTLLIFYTDYQRGSCIAYSNDSGRTWTRHARNPVLAGTEDVRDPTVFWYGPAAEWRMLRYEKKGFAFYGSTNLVDWSYLSRVEGFYECPDFVELPIEDAPGERRWVMIEADTSYVLGSFDGRQFLPETEKLRVEHGSTLYATQTWKKAHRGGSQAIQIGWLRYPRQPRLTWFSQMSFPCELTLRKFPDGVRLCRRPIDEIDNLRSAQHAWRDLTVRPGDKPLAEIRGDVFDIRAEVDLLEASGFTLMLRGQAITYSARDRLFKLAGKKAPLKASAERVQFQVLLDRSSIELFADHGQSTLSRSVFPDPEDLSLILSAEGAAMRLVSLQVNRLESIWPENELQLDHPRTEVTPGK